MEDGVVLYESAPLDVLGKLANGVKEHHHSNALVSYLVDRNINYTNVCNSDCSFCGFYRHDPNDPEAYVNSKQVIGEKIEEALKLGATRILLQGGHNDTLPYSYYTDLISWIHTTYPIEINAFSPSEVQQMMKVSGINAREILTELKSLGLSGLPGGGAEILDDEVRKRVSPKKIRTDDWFGIMEIAQELSLTTTITMVIGLGETIQHRMNHLQRTRDLQDKSIAKGLEGFNSFISWPLQHNENTSLGRSRHAANYGAGNEEYLRNVALSRIFLDNVMHHQSSWPTLGADIAQVGLAFGCDDMGSTMMEENVVSQAGALSQKKWSMSPEELRHYIREAGFTPRQRNTSFETVEIFS